MALVFVSSLAMTGGPMAIHQAAAACLAQGADARILYSWRSKSVPRVGSDGRGRMRRRLFGAKIPDALQAYGVPHSEYIHPDDHIVLPEARLDLALWLLENGFANVHFWWLSVDNFPLSRVNHLNVRRMIHQVHNACQSAYAMDFVKAHGARSAYMLTDYTQLPDFAQAPPPLAARQFDIAYLPKKAHGARDVIARLEKRFKLTRIEGLDRQGVLDRLCDTRIFLDLGHHPGKDRLPREAALCGGVPMVRYAGAASHATDVPLPEPLLIPTEDFFDEETLAARIEAVLDDPDRFTGALDAYRDTIRSEKAAFEAEIAHMVALSRAT